MNIIAFFAHPDDETMLSGGILALLAKEGAQVHYVCATRGEGGELGEPPLCTRQDLGLVRERELVCAVQALNGRSLTFLGHHDPLVGKNDELHAFSNDLTFVAGQLVSSIKQFSANIILTHGSNGEYGHPAHQFCYQAALAAAAALKSEGQDIQLYTVAASFPQHPWPRLANQDDPADLVIDIQAVIDEKVKAAMCHQTQHALFVRRASNDAGYQLTVPEVIMKIESLHRVFTALDVQQFDSFEKLLKPFVIVD